MAGMIIVIKTERGRLAERNPLAQGRANRLEQFQGETRHFQEGVERRYCGGMGFQPVFHGLHS